MRDEELPSILALDLARRMGWAYGTPGTPPRHGSVTLGPPGSDIDTIGAAFVRWMTDFKKLSPVDVLYVEAPVSASHMAGKTNATTLLNLYGLYALSVVIGKMAGIGKRRIASVQQVRKHFLGTARPADKKKAVIARCRMLGWQPQDDNAADALALWAYGCAEEAPRAAIATAPLFSANGVPTFASVDTEVPF